MISLLFFVVLLQVLYGKSTVLSETLEPVEAVAEMTDNISQLDLLVLFLFIIGVILLLASVARKERNGSSNPVKILTEESESALKRNTATDAGNPLLYLKHEISKYSWLNGKSLTDGAHRGHHIVDTDPRLL